MRVALCIGCDTYDFLNPLAGAEADAKQMFSVLTHVEFGWYDPSASRLLLSPSLDLVRQALEEVLYSDYDIHDFTIFFAGHAGIAHGSLYLTFKNTKADSIAISGLNFGELAKIIVAAKPAQANFVLDACHSAGLGLDLASILRENLIGAAETTGVSALAAAASNEYASEVDGSGVFTSALLNVLRGVPIISRANPYLSLPDIAESVRKICTDASQTVSAWMLNLQGPNRFSQNPNYSTDFAPETSSEIDLIGRRLDLQSEKIKQIKRITFDISAEINENEIADLVESVVQGRSADDSVLLISGLQESMVAEARNSPDPFAESRVLGVFLGQLLPFIEESSLAIDYLNIALARACDVVWRSLDDVVEELIDNPYLLLSGEGLSDLYFLPIRVCEVLGRIGWLLHCQFLDADQMVRVEKFVRDVLRIYGNSVVALCDEQATPIIVFVTGCIKVNWIDFAEEVIGRLFSDIIDVGGKVGHYGLSGEQSLKLLEERHDLLARFDGDLYARPSDLNTVTLILAAMLNLDEVVDPSMIHLDHTALNVFAPSKVIELGKRGPLAGKNAGLQIGNGVWHCNDVRREWHDSIQKLIDMGSCCPNEVKYSIVLSALTLRDRVPWLVMSCLKSRGQPTVTNFHVA